MILKSDVIPPVPLGENEVSCFMFEKSEHLAEFVRSIECYVKTRTANKDHPLLIMDNQFQDINKKDLFPILMDCGKFELDSEKSFKDGVVSTFEKMVFENAEVNDVFHEFQIVLDKLVNKMEFNRRRYSLELQSDSFSLRNLLKVVESDLHRNGRELNHFELRECYYDIVSSLNRERKAKILFVLYPENYLGVTEVKKFMRFLHGLSANIIVLTNDLRIIKEVKLNFINLVMHNKEVYDLIGLSNELELFDMVESEGREELTIQLGYLNFAGNEILVNDKYKSFIEN